MLIPNQDGCHGVRGPHHRESGVRKGPTRGRVPESGSRDLDVLSQLLARDTDSRSMKRQHLLAVKCRDVHLPCLIPNASFLSWGRDARPQMSDRKKEQKKKIPQVSLHFKGCESGSSCPGEKGEDLNEF